MDDGKRNLKGSPAKDSFKQWHKTLPNSFYACDCDLIPIAKYPEAGPIAVIDYKTATDSLTFTEVILYNWFTKEKVPVYVVTTNPSLPPYVSVTIKKYVGGDWRPDPPVVQLQDVSTEMPISEFTIWERKLRNGNA